MRPRGWKHSMRSSKSRACAGWRGIAKGQNRKGIERKGYREETHTDRFFFARTLKVRRNNSMARVAAEILLKQGLYAHSVY